MNTTTDLHAGFVRALYGKVPKRAELVNRIANALTIEKESASRRLSGKVNFSIKEMGMLADEFRISLDRLIRNGDRQSLWLPFILSSPMQAPSIDGLCDMTEANIQRMKRISRYRAECGSIYNSMPLEFCADSPTFLKFIFFKWGHYFVGTEEFDCFSSWELPERLSNIKGTLAEACDFEKTFYVWDVSLIWTLAKEIDNFYRMHVITPEEKDTLRQELKLIIRRMEQTLNGTYAPCMPMSRQMEFYVSSVNIGFTSCYFDGGEDYSALLQTNFSFSSIEDCRENFDRIKEWIGSFRRISVLLSKSGRIERRLFFEEQHKIIDDMLL